MSADDYDTYQKRIAELQEENTHLREAARTFGDLAERLNAELREERRRRVDRRSRSRETPERRNPNLFVERA